MASKNINVLLSLVDRFTAPMQKIASSTKETQRHIKSASNSIKGFGAGVNNRFLGLASSVGSLAAKFLTLGGILSVGGLVAYGKECMALAGAQGQAETKLAAILQNVTSIQERGPGAVANAKAALLDYAAALQKVGVVGDDVTIAGMQQLATFQLNDDEIKTLSGGMLDLLVQQKGLNATQEDAVGIANMIGKAMSGNAGALSRVGITMSDEEKNLIKYGDAEQRAAVVAQVLKNNVGGVNEAMAQTGGGKNKQAMNAYRDMMEQIGKRVSPFKAKFIGMFGSIIPAITSVVLPIIDRLGEKFEQLYPTMDAIGQRLPGAITKIGEAFDSIYNSAAPVFSFIIEHSEAIITIISMVIAGFVAFNVAIKIAAAFKILLAVMWAVSHAALIFNLIMAANPIGMICIAIAVLVGLLVLVYRNWDRIKAVALMVFDAIGAALVSIVEFVGSIFNAIIDTISQAINYVISILTAIGNAIVETLTAAWNAVIDAFNAAYDFIVSVATAIFDGMVVVATAAWSVLTTGASIMAAAVGDYINFIGAYIDDLKVVFNGIIDFVEGVFTGNWEQAWNGVLEIFTGVFDSLVDAAAGPLNIILGMVNRVIDAINSIEFKVPSWVPGIGGFEFAPRMEHIGGFATGTSYFMGGLARVNEFGGELMNLPNGTQILPHDKTIEKLSKDKRAPIIIHVNVAGNVIGNDEFINHCGEVITQKVQMAIHNA